MDRWHVICVGGGAAGFMGAITAAETIAQAGVAPKVAIWERTAKVLDKVRISGGGRCNVTHDCSNPAEFIKGSYPRGEKGLRGPMTRWGQAETVEWFESRGVKLKCEVDGRMFPVTDDSRTVMDCLRGEAERWGVKLFLNREVIGLEPCEGGHWNVKASDGCQGCTDSVLVAVGGVRLGAAERLVKLAGHLCVPAVPSLFSFRMGEAWVRELAGVSVQYVRVNACGFEAGGPILLTHEGVSGPAVLRLSAYGARAMESCGYRFDCVVDWAPGLDWNRFCEEARSKEGGKKLYNSIPPSHLPKRLWEALVRKAGVAEDATWATLRKSQSAELERLVRGAVLAVDGKSLNKDEFVTCGGVELKEVDFRSMESKLHSGLFFAGEVLDVDGVTGGFNFQNAWTTGRLAGEAMGSRAVARV